MLSLSLSLSLFFVEIGLAGIVLVEVSEHHAELLEGGLGDTTLVARLNLLFQVVRRSDD